ncbi:PH domain-containing protein [Mycobacterium sp. NPDC050551]|uniref:PH domain-containing protein n=1 Tax=Mycobacterium sp. NPDC050551 TaxID=3155407 RepID=UPI00342DC30C
MAHLAVGFFAFALLAVVLSTPPVSAALFLLPIALSALIIRYRTVADQDTVTARRAFGSTTVPWSDIEGLQFGKGAWASARLVDGTELRLPAVTFATLPELTEISAGRVPNPYA